MGEATVTGAYADLYGASRVNYLCQVLAADCIGLALELETFIDGALFRRADRFYAATNI